MNININVGTSIDGELVKISRPFISCIYFNRAEAKYNLDDFQGALDDYSKLLEISPDIPEVFTKRGLVKKALKDINGSYKDLEKAAELGDDEAAKLLKEHCK